MAHRGAEPIEASQIAIVDVADGSTRVVAGETSVDSGVAWLSDGSLLFTSDADGWFQVVRLTADGHDRIVLTSGDREHGTPGPAAPGTGLGHAPLPSPDESRFVHIEIHDGLQDLLVGELAGAQPPKRGRGRPPKTPRVVTAAATGARINPWDGVWRVVGWLADGAWVAAVGERVTAPQDLWLLPVPGVAPDGARPRQVTDSMPAVLRAALQPSRVAAGRADHRHRPRRAAGRGHAVASPRRDRQAWRPAGADGHLPARRPDRPGVPLVPAVQAGPRGRGLRPVRRGLPRLERVRPRVPPRQPRGVGRGGRQRPDRRRALGGRAALVGRPAGDLRRLVRRLHGPLRARRGAVAVARRGGPVRGLGDRRELPPRRPGRDAATCTR